MKYVLILMIFFTLLRAMASDKCSDSDGGRNPLKAGAVLFSLYQSCPQDNECLQMTSLEKDFCQNSEDLREHWCAGDELKVEVIVCPKGCADSRCK